MTGGQRRHKLAFRR